MTSHSDMIDAIRFFYQAEMAKIKWEAPCNNTLKSTWAETMAMGLGTLLSPEDQGGLGLSALEAVQIAEEAGKTCFPLPVSQAMLLSALTPALDHTNQELQDWLAGSRLLSIAQNSPTTSEYILEYAQHSPLALAICHIPDGVQLQLYQHQAHTLANLDPSIQASQTQLPPDALYQSTTLADPDQRFYTLSLLLRLAELIGTSSQAHQLATDYAKERMQFGRAIGSNQSIKHRLADQWMALDHCRLALYDAAQLWSAKEALSPQFHFALQAALVLTIEAAKDITSYCVQVHGALGFTWEYPAHWYLKRAHHHCLFLEQQQPIADVLDRIWTSAELIKN